jgi:hypothetical protein
LVVGGWLLEAELEPGKSERVRVRVKAKMREERRTKVTDKEWGKG